ncbi:hypothetical protein EMGBS3_14190 [Anaerolineaceae bacterium]|nr:hypothetical protein EMGBS3_14190 [Anaerolineaceae bacterium]
MLLSPPAVRSKFNMVTDDKVRLKFRDQAPRMKCMHPAPRQNAPQALRTR